MKLLRLLIALAFAALMGGAALALATGAAVHAAPSMSALDVVEPLLARLSTVPPLPAAAPRTAERSVMLAADGTTLGYLVGEENRVQLRREEIPDLVVDALLAAEDDRFYEHRGIDATGITRALIANVEAGQVTQGGSTITQQLVENTYLPDPETLREKIDSAYYAVQLERRLTKDEILTRYLNEVYFGQQAYGIAAAAERYFSASVDELRVDQAAMLVGLLPAPSSLNPIDDPEGALRVRNRVLDRMVATDRLDAPTAAQARKRDLGLDPATPPRPRFPFFTEYVRHELLNSSDYDDILGTDPEERERLVYGGGLTIHTTLSRRLQRVARRTIARIVDEDRPPQAALVTLRPASGDVKAIAVGPRRFGPCDRRDKRRCERTMVNPAVPGLGGSGRQPGSAFKPFVAATALREGIPRGWEMETEGGKRIPGCRDGDDPYRPRNYAPDPGVKDMREAVRVSSNVYFARLAGLVGPGEIIRTARRVGLNEAHLPEGCALALGAGSVTPLEMAVGYATFANDGRRCAPRVVTRIDVAGTSREIDTRCERVLGKRVARQVTGLLQLPVEAGTATAAQIGRPVAGKTGTTQDHRDAWFVGYVPQLVTATWVGYEQPRPLVDVLGHARITGGSVPARLWASFMQRALRDARERKLPSPSVTRLEVPWLVGKRLSQVRDDLEYDFKLDVVRVEHHRRRGTIVGQRPAPGTRVAAGSTIVVRVSNGQGTATDSDSSRGDREAEESTTDEPDDSPKATEDPTDAQTTDPVPPAPEPSEPENDATEAPTEDEPVPTEEPTQTDPEPTETDPEPTETEVEPTEDAEAESSTDDAESTRES